MMELTSFAVQYAEAMAQSTGLFVCITDRDQVIAVAGGAKKDLLQKNISRQLDRPSMSAVLSSLPGKTRHSSS